MRNNKNKGFTLVELLVVIAILAILATVSVVGYTSFIKSATVSNDENIAAQLNKFLAAFEADSTSNYYGEEIDENNIREITSVILKDSGLDSLLPQAEKYGYHFYYDLKEDKYLVIDDEDPRVKKNGFKVLMAWMGIPVSAEEGNTYEVKPENSFTEGNRYFLVDTDSLLGLLVKDFYKVDSKTAFEKLQQDASNSVLSDYVDNVKIYTDNGNYAATSSSEYVVFVDNIVKVTNDTTVIDGSETHTVTINTNTTITVPDSVKYIEGDALNVEGTGNITIVINKTAEEVGEIANSSFTNIEINISGSDVNVKCEVDSTDDVTYLVHVENNVNVTIKEPLNFTNSLASFDGCITSGSENKYNASLGAVAWEKGVNITLAATNFVGEDPTIPATGTDTIVWDTNIGTVSVENNVATLVVDSITSVNDIPKTITFTGTAANGVTATYTVEVVYLTSVDYTIDNNSVTTYADGLTLVYGENGKTTFDVVQLLGTPNKVVEGIELAPAAYITANNNFTYADGVLTPANTELHGEYAITINTEAYPHLKKEFTLDIFNTKYLSLTKAHLNHKYVGDDNAITLGDLFAATGNEIPEGAKVLVYTVYGDTKFTFIESTLGKSDLANANLYALNADWKTTPVQFNDGATTLSDNAQYKVAVTVVYQDERGNYIRVADSHELIVIDGINVTSFSQLNGSTNNILYSNIAMSDTDSILTISSGKTLYGSGYSIDMTGYNDEGTPFTIDGSDSFYFTGLKKTVKYSKTDEALITLNGATLSNVKVVGEAYKSSDFLYQDPTNFAYGASLVKANSGSIIEGCYLANTRSPLKVTGTVTVEDSVLFGGNYANIDVAATKNSSDKLIAGELILKGTVTTINQIIEGETDETLGVGIVVDLFAHKDTKITIESNETLVQYNYVKKNSSSNLPIVTYTMDLGDSIGKEDVNVFLSTEVGKVFTESQYSGWVYENEGGEYFNAGIFFLNGMEFDASGSSFLTNLGAAAVEGILKGMFGDASGDGSKLGAIPDGYEKSSTVVTRTATKAGITINLKANVYIYSPKSGNVAFNNNVPADYLPSNVLGE